MGSRRRVGVMVATGLLLFGVGAVSVKARSTKKTTASLRTVSQGVKGDSPASPRDVARDTSLCTSPERGPVLKGVDVVAYFDLESGAAAVHGSKEYDLEWGGYKWLFSTESNRDKFLKDPEKYMPQYGGFCSYGVTHESTWTATTLGPNTNPDTWKIINDKLYLFMYGMPQTEFMVEDVDAEITMGDKRWSDWFDGKVIMNTACMWYCDQASAEMDSNTFKQCLSASSKGER